MYFIELNTESILQSKVAPTLFVIFLIALLLKIVFFMHFRGIGHPVNTGEIEVVSMKSSSLNSDFEPMD